MRNCHHVHRGPGVADGVPTVGAGRGMARRPATPCRGTAGAAGTGHAPAQRQPRGRRRPAHRRAVGRGPAAHGRCPDPQRDGHPAAEPGHRRPGRVAVAPYGQRHRLRGHRRGAGPARLRAGRPAGPRPGAPGSVRGGGVRSARGAGPLARLRARRARRRPGPPAAGARGTPAVHIGTADRAGAAPRSPPRRGRRAGHARPGPPDPGVPGRAVPARALPGRPATGRTRRVPEPAGAPGRRGRPRPATATGRAAAGDPARRRSARSTGGSATGGHPRRWCSGVARRGRPDRRAGAASGRRPGVHRADRAVAPPGRGPDRTHRRGVRDHGDGRRRQDGPGGALGPPRAVGVPGRPAVREPARLRSQRIPGRRDRMSCGPSWARWASSRGRSRSASTPRARCTGACSPTGASWSSSTTRTARTRSVRCCPARPTASSW